jgi:hypothetical protein
VLAQFSWGRIAELTLEYYRDLLDGAPRSPTA